MREAVPCCAVQGWAHRDDRLIDWLMQNCERAAYGSPVFSWELWDAVVDAVVPGVEFYEFVLGAAFAVAIEVDGVGTVAVAVERDAIAGRMVADVPTHEGVVEDGDAEIVEGVVVGHIVEKPAIVVAQTSEIDDFSRAKDGRKSARGFGLVDRLWADELEPVGDIVEHMPIIEASARVAEILGVDIQVAERLGPARPVINERADRPCPGHVVGPVGFTGDEVVEVIGVRHQGHADLPLVGHAHCAPPGLAGLGQCGQEDADEQRDDRDDDEKFDQGEGAALSK